MGGWVGGGGGRLKLIIQLSVTRIGRFPFQNRKLHVNGGAVGLAPLMELLRSIDMSVRMFRTIVLFSTPSFGVGG